MHRNQAPHRRLIATTRQGGFSLTEVLLATLLIVLALVPALDAIQSGIQGSGVHRSSAENHLALSGKMEELLAQPFDELASAADAAGGSTVLVAGYSDSAGAQNRRLVYLAHYDGDSSTFSAAETGLIWLRVSIENSDDALESLITR